MQARTNAGSSCCQHCLCLTWCSGVAAHCGQDWRCTTICCLLLISLLLPEHVCSLKTSCCNCHPQARVLLLPPADQQSLHRCLNLRPV